MITHLSAPNLSQRPPRSPRCRLGGYAILPRVLDKCRATIAGTNGEYNFDCPLDKHFFNFTGIEPEAFKAEVATGKGDGEMIEWVEANSKTMRMPWEVIQWSDYHDRRGPTSDAETFLFFVGRVAEYSKTREDVRTWWDLMDLDDHITFGGKA